MWVQFARSILFLLVATQREQGRATAFRHSLTGVVYDGGAIARRSNQSLNSSMGAVVVDTWANQTGTLTAAARRATFIEPATPFAHARGPGASADRLAAGAEQAGQTMQTRSAAASNAGSSPSAAEDVKRTPPAGLVEHFAQIRAAFLRVEALTKWQKAKLVAFLILLSICACCWAGECFFREQDRLHRESLARARERATCKTAEVRRPSLKGIGDVLARGKANRGVGAEEKYRFGDFTRGIVHSMTTPQTHK